MKLERYYMGEKVGGFPRMPDYLNYRWYFASEKYQLSFQYSGNEELIKLTIQPNIIGFESFMKKVVQQTNIVLEDANQANTSVRSLSKSLFRLAIILTE